MSKTYRNITGAELLRSDSYSQKILITDKNGNSKNLVSMEQFWGNEHSDSLFFDYRNSSNRGWAIEQDGWNDYSMDTTQHITSSQIDNWVEKNIFCSNISTVSIIQGYAGCGKTIFVNSILRDYMSKTQYINIDYHDVYVDYDTNATESGYLPSSIRNSIIKHIIGFLSNDDGLEVYKKFIYLLTKYSEMSGSFSDLLSLFSMDGEISILAKQIYEYRKDCKKLQSIEADFKIQFISSTMAIVGAYKGMLYLNKEIYLEDLALIEEKYIKTLLEYYLIIDLIFLYANSLQKKQDKVIIFYDNLDIIDNPQHIAFFISKLQDVLHKIMLNFMNNNSIPVFNIILAVRKITYALVSSSFSEVNYPERGSDDVYVKFLDISNLYSSTHLLKHKAIILKNNLHEYIPKEYNRTDVKKFLNALIDIPEETLDDICLIDLFNHNIRACANILEKAMEHSSSVIPKEIDTKRMTEKCRSAIWIHSICSVLHEKKVWHHLGYNTNDNHQVHYPTTLSRLILTYLYNQRRESRYSEDGCETTEISFKKIVEIFEKIPFYSFTRDFKGKKGELTAKKYTKEDTQKKIITAISEMLKRNNESDGINSHNEMELWRRPIYFTKNAFPLLDKMGQDNIKKALEQQIAQFNDPSASITDFCITDEGHIFIEKIATNFEFYSVRYNGRVSIPLCFITDIRRLNFMIEKVYLKVKACIDNHHWLMNYFIQKYGKSHNDPSNINYINDINEYLSQKFHPRTENHKPQLHIVRTIYDHIYYLNDYRDYLMEINHKNLNELNLCIIRWIGFYLKLYSDNLFDLLNKTSSNFNEVFLDLKYLYWRVYSDNDHLPFDEDEKKKISINRNMRIRKSSKIKISDEKLRNDPMLIEFPSKSEPFGFGI